MGKSRFITLALFALTAVGASSSFAAEQFEIVGRKKNGRSRYETVELPLLAPGRYETTSFKVVWKRESEALTDAKIAQLVDSKQSERTAEELRMMAANSLYHAEKARRFFADRLGSEEARNLPQVLLRLDITNLYNDQAQFAHDANQPQYNNVLTIPAGKPRVDAAGAAPWNREIWFRPRKEIPIRDILAALPEDPMNAQIRQARAQLYPMQIDLTLRETLIASFQNRLDADGFVESVVRQGGTILLMEGAFQVLKFVNRLIIPQRYYLDTAFIPEVIYHETAHAVLGDYLAPNLSTPVNEGVSDYFAASIGGNPKIAKKIREYSTVTGKNGKRRQAFQMEFETLGKAHSDFVLSLLWGLRGKLGADTMDRVVFESRKHLSTRDSNIRRGLPNALLLACEKVCESPLRDRMKIHEYLDSRGL